MATRSPARNLDGQGRPADGLDDRGEREALKRYRGPDEPEHWEGLARATARRFGVDENLAPRERCMAIVRAMGGTPTLGMREPNPRHLRALLEAVESGRPERWRRARIAEEEIAAARRTLGRPHSADRTPGEDDE